jgi:hypothetical protein
VIARVGTDAGLRDLWQKITAADPKATKKTALGHHQKPDVSPSNPKCI